MSTLKHHNLAQSLDLLTILAEVRMHGFYVIPCNELVNIAQPEQAFCTIRQLADHANLRVSFNVERNLCVFEAQNSECYK